MNTMLIFVDQTLQQGLNKHLPHQKVMSMVEQLYKLNLVRLDIGWQDIKAYDFPKVFLNRLRVAMPPDIAILSEAVQYGVSKINILYEHLPAQGLAEDLRRFLQVVRHVGIGCSLTLTHAPSFSVNEVQTIWQKLDGMQFESFIYQDTDSMLEPQTTFAMLRELQALSPYPLEFHAHDGLGLATANTLSAIEAGIRTVATSAGGSAEHASFEQVIMGAKHLLQMDLAVDPQLATRCQAIAACLGQTVKFDQPVIGDNIFAHESGLHVFGIMKNAKIYEPFSPEEVGLQRHLILGRHSGASFLTVLLHKLGIIMAEQQLRDLLETIHQLVIRQKKPVSYQQLCELCQREVL